MKNLNNNDFNILIADDLPLNIQTLKSVLLSENYKVEEAKNGKEALDLALEKDFDIILLDIVMPRMNGFEVCRRLKLEKSKKDIPIIFLTAETDIDSVVTGLELGAVDYVCKPFNTIELLARVKTHITLRVLNNSLQKEIEERKKTEKLLRANELHLKKINATKDKIFSIIINDLSEPVSKLFSNTEFLSFYYKKLDRYKIEEKMEELTLSSIRLKRLFENIVTWSRSQKNKISFFPKNVNFHKILSSNLEIFEKIILQKSLKINVNIDKNIFVFADENMLSIILKNLISNAIKFSFENKEIDIFTKKTGNFLKISIEDYGIGIKKIDIKNLFKIDTQYHKIGNNTEEGAGLGLIICKEFIEINKGEIFLESEIKKGSKFTFTLPCLA